MIIGEPRIFEIPQCGDSVAIQNSDCDQNPQVLTGSDVI